MARKKDSKLVTYTKFNDNYWVRTPEKANLIFVHHMAGKMTSKSCADYFSRVKVSSNYTIGYQGDIAQCVEEKYGAWCQGSKLYNKRGISIECSNSANGSDHVTDKTINSCIKLVADIGMRNEFKEIKYTGDKKGNLWMHKWVANTGCPGSYLSTKFKYIADEANKLMIVLPTRGYFERNDSSEQIKKIQRFLKAQKLYNGKIGGNYKTLTEAAVRSFQKKFGLTVDGLWGKECNSLYITLV